jgi:phage recombination protein Bet
MAKTRVKEETETVAAQTELLDEATDGKKVTVRFAQPRLPYHPAIQDRFGVDRGGWQVLIDAIWPGAKTVDAVAMALSYCKARNLDPFKKVVHIVPMYSRAVRGMIETVWPGIAEIRTTAFRTGQYAGMDDAAFGPMVETDFDNAGDRQKTLRHPEWCQITVYRELHGRVCKFVGPKVYWLEAYATEKNDSDYPNEMWWSRSVGQIEKCAEAASLRRAFPEEIGNLYAAEEMEGRTIMGATIPGTPPPELLPETKGAAAVDLNPPSPKPPAAGEAAKPAAGASDAAKAANAPTATPEAPSATKPKRQVEQDHSRALRVSLNERIAGTKTVDELGQLRADIDKEMDALSEGDRDTVEAVLADRMQELQARAAIAANPVNAG